MPFHSNHSRGPRPDRESRSDKRQQERIRQREADRRQQEKAEREKRAREAEALRKRKQAEAIKARQLKAQEEAKRKARNTVKTPPKKTPSQELPRVMMKPPPSKPAKPKPATLFGMSIKAPKSDVQKKIDSGQATVIATRKLDSGKSLISTNKQTGRITTKAEENRMISAGRSPTMQGGPRTSNVPLPISKPKPGGSTMAVRQIDPSGTKTMTALTPRRPSAPKTGPVYKGQPLTPFKPKGQSSLLSQLPSKTGGTPTGAKVGIPKVNITELPPMSSGTKDDNVSSITPVKTPPKQPSINSGSLIYDFNKRMFGSYQGGELEQRKFLQGSKAPTVSSFIGSITSAVKNTGSWWRNAGDAQLKINKEMNKKIKSQLGAK